MRNLKFKQNVSNLIIYFFMFLLLYNIKSTYSFGNELLLQQVDSLLKSNDCMNREAGVHRLLNSTDIDTIKAINMLMKSLNDEILNPFRGKTARGSYAPASEFLKRQYLNGLIKLYINKAEILESAIDTSTGELKERLIIIAFYVGDTTRHAKIVNIFNESKDNWLRLDAIESLRQMADTADIYLFKNALADTFSILYKSDFGPLEGELHFPIRNVASGALRKLGFKMKRNDNEYIIVKEPEK